LSKAARRARIGGTSFCAAENNLKG